MVLTGFLSLSENEVGMVRYNNLINSMFVPENTRKTLGISELLWSSRYLKPLKKKKNPEIPEIIQ